MKEARLFHVLLVAATPFEIEPTVNWLRARAHGESANVLSFRKTKVEVLFTGVGPSATAYTMGYRFGGLPVPDFALQAGVGGAYTNDFQLGELVQVVSERFGDAGAQDKDGSYLSLGDIGLHPGLPFTKAEELVLPKATNTTPFRHAHGLTVSQATGTTARREAILERWPTAELESMEGAPFFRACLEAGLSPLQVRAVSNYVEERDRSKWEMELAIERLNDGLKALIGPFIRD